MQIDLAAGTLDLNTVIGKYFAKKKSQGINPRVSILATIFPTENLMTSQEKHPEWKRNCDLGRERNELWLFRAEK